MAPPVEEGGKVATCAARRFLPVRVVAAHESIHPEGVQAELLDSGLVYMHLKIQNFTRFLITSNLAAYHYQKTEIS
jgi:hypothetical protein